MRRGVVSVDSTRSSGCEAMRLGIRSMAFIGA